LGTLLTDQIFAIPNNEGIILNLCTGKTVDICDPRVVVVLKCDSLEYCPVNGNALATLSTLILFFNS
jgi:hypothetical protein